MNNVVNLAERRLKKIEETLSMSNLALTQNNTAIAQTTAQEPYFPSEKDWGLMLSWGSSALKSGFLPSAIKSPEQAAIIALKGRELGIPFMQALSHIHVINGKPSMSAEMMQALARRNLPGLVINIIESTHEKAQIEFLRPEKGSKPYTSIFTIQDAQRAELMNKTVWKQYPSAMLWSRAISAGLRKVCPEALMGVSYTPEELGGHVDQEGNIIETTSRKVESAPTLAIHTKKVSEFDANDLPDLDANNPVDVASVVSVSDGSNIKNQVITDKQREKLFAMLPNCYTTDAQLRAYIKEKMKIDSIKDIPIKHFENLLTALTGGWVSKTQPVDSQPVEFPEDPAPKFFKSNHPGVDPKYVK